MVKRTILFLSRPGAPDNPPFAYDDLEIVRKYRGPNQSESHYARKIVIPGMNPEITKWDPPLNVHMWASRCADHIFGRRIPLYDFVWWTQTIVSGSCRCV